MVRFDDSYKPRTVRFLELWEYGDWRVKVYGITYEGDCPCDHAVSAAKELAARELPMPAVTEDRYGIGFLIVHEARDCYWYILDFWSHQNALQHRIYSAPFVNPDHWEDVTLKGPNMCVWELGVMCHERQVWILNVLSNPAEPDFEAYLRQGLHQKI